MQSLVKGHLREYSSTQSGKSLLRPYKAVDRVSPIFSKMHFLPMPHGSMLKAAFRAHQVIQAV